MVKPFYMLLDSRSIVLQIHVQKSKEVIVEGGGQLRYETCKPSFASRLR